MVLLHKRTGQKMKLPWGVSAMSTFGRNLVSVRELPHLLKNDAEKLGVKVDYTLRLRKYSRKNFGTYNPRTHVVTLYVFQDEQGQVPYTYEELFHTLLHEIVHCMQFSELGFVRIKGVMHDAEFYHVLRDLESRAPRVLQDRRDVEIESLPSH